MLLLIVASCIAAGVVYLIERKNGAVILIGGGMLLGVLAAFFQNPKRSLIEAEYLSLPGSRLSSGATRCIHCGSPRLFKKGEYQTEDVITRCVGCQAELFVD